jgi:hypothetical protein
VQHIEPRISEPAPRTAHQPAALNWRTKRRRLPAVALAKAGEISTASLPGAPECNLLIQLSNSQNASGLIVIACEPTGRANARPMTGSTKQSTAKDNGLLRRVRLRSLSCGGQVAPRNDAERAVSHHSSFRGAPTGPRKARPDDRLRASPESILPIVVMDSVFSPAGCPGMTVPIRISNSQSQIWLRDLAARCARVVHETFAQWRAWGMPGAQCTRSLACKW